MVNVTVPIGKEDYPEELRRLLSLRQQARDQRDYAQSDKLRDQIKSLGFLVNDNPVSTSGDQVPYEVLKIGDQDKKVDASFLVLFGSGENAPSAVDTYRQIFMKLGKRDLRIALVTSPAGFQPNVESVYQEIKDYLLAGLPDFNLTIDIVYANTHADANDPKVASQVAEADIIFTGPGSPTYAVKVLKNSLLYSQIIERVKSGATLILASAATIAFSRHALPVYEIYKVGMDLQWVDGLNAYKEIWQEMTIIPHFNNTEGGEGLDTTHCYIGKDRFEKMKKMLVVGEPMMGIDEHTAYIVDLQSKESTIKGKGGTTNL